MLKKCLCYTSLVSLLLSTSPAHAFFGDPLGDEAQEMVEDSFVHCGDASFLVLKTTDKYQIVEPEIDVIAEDVSDADKANGREWLGVVTIEGKMSRSALNRDKAGEWREGFPTDAGGVWASKEHGVWQFRIFNSDIYNGKTYYSGKGNPEDMAPGIADNSYSCEDLLQMFPPSK